MRVRSLPDALGHETPSKSLPGAWWGILNEGEEAKWCVKARKYERGQALRYRGRCTSTRTARWVVMNLSTGEQSGRLGEGCLSVIVETVLQLNHGVTVNTIDDEHGDLQLWVAFFEWHGTFLD
jgi:hypothetical protein